MKIYFYFLRMRTIHLGRTDQAYFLCLSLIEPKTAFHKKFFVFHGKNKQTLLYFELFIFAFSNNRVCLFQFFDNVAWNSILAARVRRYKNGGYPDENPSKVLKY